MFGNKKIKELEAKIIELQSVTKEIVETSHRIDKEELKRIEQFNNLFAYNGTKQEDYGEN